MDNECFKDENIKFPFQAKFNKDKELYVFVNSCVHNGILDEMLNRTFQCPIPSLKTIVGSSRNVKATKGILESRLKTQRLPDIERDPSVGQGSRLD
ncbi:MAG: hypothetical protein OXC80_05630 [Gammaproteobacteria bacterium]|nr:hypothetical protein [Gammaproteobacteria bacterium]